MSSGLLTLAMIVAIPWTLWFVLIGTRRTVREDSDQKAALITLLIWLGITIPGFYFARTLRFYPTVASDKGEDIAHAFRILTIMAVPVFALVVSVMAYSILRRGSSDEPLQDGPAHHGSGPVPKLWFVLTSALTLLVIIYPGLTSLTKVQASPTPDMVVRLEAMQWTWLVSYPDEGVSNQQQLVLPVDAIVRFEMTSRDVIHSFWMPSLLVKADLVPGQTTAITVRLTKKGDYDTDPLVRVQCAELCGVSHSSMMLPAKVVSQSEFDEWVRQVRR